MGENLLDPNARPAAAKAGYDQGVSIADGTRSPTVPSGPRPG
ncbi:MAG: hypothetical protein ACRDOI_33595 [Trebonia sp.]